MLLFVQFLYDLDIVDEEHIIEWGDAQASRANCSLEMSKALKEKSAKVIEWLKTAEEETSEEVLDIFTKKYSIILSGV